MNKKKWLVTGGVGVTFLSLFLVNFVSAYSPGFGADTLLQGSQTLVNYVVSWASPFLQALLGGNDWTGQLLFEKFLLFILLFSFIWLSLTRTALFKNQRPVKIIICFVVSILAVRYLDFIWINTIISQYQLLGIAMTSIIPFIIYFFFINGIFPDNSTLRKIGWIFFICVYIGLYITSSFDTYGSVYFWTGAVAFAFLLMDGTIHRVWLKQLAKDNMNDVVRKRIAELGENIALLERNPSPGSKGQVERLRREQEKYMNMLK